MLTDLKRRCWQILFAAEPSQQVAKSCLSGEAWRAVQLYVGTDMDTTHALNFAWPTFSAPALLLRGPRWTDVGRCRRGSL
eukprot:scaffold68436_cov18-Prasinocladus_malaysianus.AAC.1